MSHAVNNPALMPPGTSPVQAPLAPGRAAGTARVPGSKGVSFADVLAKQVDGVRFSGHALQRLERRGIDLGGGTLERLEAGVARAAGKGARDAVVFVDDNAFVVSVRNKTVITAVDREHMREHVFTNVDSAVIA